MKCSLIHFLFLASFVMISAKEVVLESFEVKAKRVQEKIEIDGLLSEKVWNNGTGVKQFTQREPNEGAPPTEETEVFVAYDDEALYIAARMYDSNPDSIVARLGRRDAWMSTDMFGFFIDPYHDKRSGYYFALSAAGTQCDGVLMNDEWDDDSWDGVWDGKAKIDHQGWNVEFRIPFSQLRFKPQDNYVWGINFRRDITRKNEQLYLVYTPRDGSGFVSRFPDLVGIENIKPSNAIEVLPYARAKAEFTNPDPADPFNDGSVLSPAIGMDFKIGLSSNLTLNGSVNPDFGQVEVDPAVVNLSDVETYFSEKRPFFIEGASIFRFGRGGSRSHWSFNWGNPDFFYSRRIGRSPQGSLPDNDYAEVPDGTRILGAGKLTGKLGDNWNMGVLHAVTAREYAKTDFGGLQSKSEVEPLTHYTVARLQKEIDEGFQGLGVIGTSTIRDFKDDRLRNDMNSQAFSLGLDGWTFFDKDRTWVVSAWGGVSHIAANKQRMTDVQRSSTHYFQRPDAKSVSIDSQTTTMNGYAGRILVNKQKGNVIFNSAIGVINPGFDVNDLGFMWRTNIINTHMGIGYKWTEPGKIFRYSEVIGAGFYSADFDGNTTWTGVWGLAFMRFLNYYKVRLMTAYNPETISITKTRGGPMMLTPPGVELELYAESDDRKNVVIGLEGDMYYRSDQEWWVNTGVDFTWKPLPNINFSISPSIEWNVEYAQYVDTFEDPEATHTYGYRYVFANMDQITFSSGIRLNWTFTPKLSLQLYAQPLVSTADYYNYKELDRPKSYDFIEYGIENSTINLDGDEYIVDPDGAGPAGEIEWENPDFNIKSLRGNAVLRWEYQPGSTLYFVWTQSRFDYQETNQFHITKSLSDMARLPADNIFMVKMTYWLNF